jgi:hypothetical protein
MPKCWRMLLEKSGTNAYASLVARPLTVGITSATGCWRCRMRKLPRAAPRASLVAGIQPAMSRSGSGQGPRHGSDWALIMVLTVQDRFPRLKLLLISILAGVIEFPPFDDPSVL